MEVESNDYGPQKDISFSASVMKRMEGVENEDGKGSGIKDNPDEIKANLAKLKKELGMQPGIDLIMDFGSQRKGQNTTLPSYNTYPEIVVWSNTIV